MISEEFWIKKVIITKQKRWREKRFLRSKVYAKKRQ